MKDKCPKCGYDMGMPKEGKGKMPKGKPMKGGAMIVIGIGKPKGMKGAKSTHKKK